MWRVICKLEGAFKIFGSLVHDVGTWQVVDFAASPETSLEFGEKLGGEDNMHAKLNF